jgi:ribonuclease VapC
MIIDTSALIAILHDEPERRAFNGAIEATDTCLLSAASLVEASAVMESYHGYEGVRDLERFKRFRADRHRSSDGPHQKMNL